MAKKVDELAEQLNDQGDNIKRILLLMEGDGMGGGIVPNINAMKTDIHALKEWRTQQESSKGKIDLGKLGRRLGFVWTAFKWAAAFTGIPITAMTLYKLIFD